LYFRKLAALVVLILAAANAHADFDLHTEVITVGPGHKYIRIYRLEKNQNVMIGVSAGDEKPKLICGIVDTDNDVVTEDTGSSCTLTFKAGYSGKYRLIILNKGSEEARLVISGM
jgi:hypothetical protein